MRIPLALLALALAGCSSTPPPVVDAYQEERFVPDQFTASGGRSVVAMAVIGNPFDSPDPVFARQVVEAMSTYAGPAFTVNTQTNRRPFDRVVMVFNPSGPVSYDDLCRDQNPATGASPAAGQLRVAAAFCRNDWVLSGGAMQVAARSARDRSFRVAMSGLTDALFPVHDRSVLAIVMGREPSRPALSRSATRDNPPDELFPTVPSPSGGMQEDKMSPEGVPQTHGPGNPSTIVPTSDLPELQEKPAGSAGAPGTPFGADTMRGTPPGGTYGMQGGGTQGGAFGTPGGSYGISPGASSGMPGGGYGMDAPAATDGAPPAERRSTRRSRQRAAPAPGDDAPYSAITPPGTGTMGIPDPLPDNALVRPNLNTSRLIAPTRRDGATPPDPDLETGSSGSTN